MCEISRPLPYKLTLVKTETAIGYFACLPPSEMTFDKCLEYLKAHPNDVFMRKHVLEQIGSWKTKEIYRALNKIDDYDNPLLSLFYEAVFLSDRFHKIRRDLKNDRLKSIAGNSPFIYLRACLQPDHKLHKRWIELFRRNMNDHKPMPAPEQSGLPFPFKGSRPTEQKGNLPSIESLREKIISIPLPETPIRPAPETTARVGLERLERFGVVQGPLQRHEASLSPVALLRQWHMKIKVENGCHNYALSGTQTAYGRGLSLEDAMASYVMEMVERKSSFASFSGEKVEGYRRDYRLFYGSYSEIRKGEVAVLDPNTIALEVPYHNEPLYWIKGEKIGPKGYEPMLVPAQCVFLFCNLDEIKLFSGLGSTGLASGNSLEEAKISALLENIERDHERVTPFDPRKCFTIETRDSFLADLLQRYRQQGIHLQFQDLTSSMGVPCCKCFVIDNKKNIVKASGANLNATKALISAMTETPFPFPSWHSSILEQDRLIRVPVDNLPNYSTGNTAGDLALLETVLAAHGFFPIYVDLTREDIDLPVVRAIVPGMEIVADFEWYSRVSPRLFYNYLEMMNS